MTSEKRPTLMVPNMCDRHQHLFIVHELDIPEAGPWRVALITGQLLLFQAFMADKIVGIETEGNIEKLQPYLTKAGCLACWHPGAYEAMVQVMKKHGLDTAAHIAQNKVKVEGWPPPERTVKTFTCYRCRRPLRSTMTVEAAIANFRREWPKDAEGKTDDEIMDAAGILCEDCNAQIRSTLN